MVERLFAAQPELRSRYAQASPMKRLGEPEEIAESIAWLCSNSASFVNGVALEVDGGMAAS
jgi:NAD(P)-dependent dehydrogenase (short-subunit alcohol dehydrogenase family)